MSSLFSKILNKNVILLCKRYASSLKEGTKLPNSVLFENTPGNKVNVHDLFNGKKGILLGVPGAFTPTCSNVTFQFIFDIQNLFIHKNQFYLDSLARLH
jgi:hypothetical protein